MRRFFWKNETGFPSQPGTADRSWLWIGVVVALGVSFAACGGDRTQVTEDTLAVIGDRVITKADFVERYREFRRRTGEGVPDTYQARREVLSQYVDEEILITEAERCGFAEDAAGQHELRRLQMQELLNAFNRNFIANEVEITEAELKTLFVRLNTQVKARHLYARTQEAADSLYRALQRGATFEELAKHGFEDPRLRDSGGSVGYFTVDDMEPAFEEAAFALDVGEISRPVRTSEGYSIIRVDQRVTRPLLTETEYAKHKEKLRAYWHKRKTQEATQAFVQELADQLDIVFNEDVVELLYGEFRSRQESTTAGEAEDAFLGLNGLADAEVLRSKHGTWTLETLQDKARFTTSAQHQWINNRQEFEEFISGLVVRDEVLRRARKAGLHEETAYREAVQEKFDLYLLESIRETLRAEMVIPEDSLRAYFEEDPSRFARPPEVRLREIVVRSSERAETVRQALRAGVDFAELARKHSVRRWSAEAGGELGYLRPQDLGRWAPRVFTLEVGEIAGPIEMDSLYVFLQCLDKKSQAPRSFEEARAEVRRTVRYLAWPKFREEKIAVTRASLKRLRMFPEKLKTIRLNQAL